MIARSKMTLGIDSKFGLIDTSFVDSLSDEKMYKDVLNETFDSEDYETLPELEDLKQK